MRPTKILDLDYLRKRLSYDPLTGIFTHNKIAGFRIVGHVAKNERRAGTFRHLRNGYIQVSIGIDGKYYVAARLAWFYIHGIFPPDQIDHINGDSTDNRIANLRLATQSQNNQNLSLNSRNKTGYMGIHWCNRDKKYRAQIKNNGRKIFLGYFANAEDAYQAYLEAKKKLHTFQPTPREQTP